jgi:hypothetical protein
VRQTVQTNGGLVVQPVRRISAGASGIPAGSVNCVRNSAGRTIRVEHWARISESTARRYCNQG